ncbi:MAG TPA: hypothetical protein VNO52_10895 [Methylomirabilota bacterium]|nr:hypothetical protein [Methylomirabilota bacterium]
MNALVSLVREAAQPLTGSLTDDDALRDLVGGARFALLGEASRGMHEFDRERAQITKRLIKEKGFAAVALEALPAAGAPAGNRFHECAHGQGKRHEHRGSGTAHGSANARRSHPCRTCAS